MINEKQLYECLNINKMTSFQKEAVLSNDTPILVSASAGSGKTLVLSTRVVYKLANPNDPIDPKDLLVVTFAKDAAKEMLERISSTMKKLVLKYPDNKQLKKQQSLLSQANITTIDAFCSNLLREKFELANLSPNFRIAEEAEIEQIKSQIIDEIFEMEYEKSPKEFQDFCDYFSLNSDYGLKNAILEIYKKHRTHPFPKKYLSEILFTYTNPPSLNDSNWAKEVKQGIYDQIKKAESLLFNSFSAMDDPILRRSFTPNVDEMISILKDLSKKINNSKFSDIINIVDNVKFKSLPRYNKKTNPFDMDLSAQIKRKYIEPAKKIIKSLKDYAITEQQYDDDLKKQLPIIKKLIDVTKEFSNKLEIKKNELNILEFSDLLLKTLDMFINSSGKEPKLTSFGEEMSKRFKEVLVDEFQDVNQAQDMLFRVLSNNNKNIFMVGDLKQSIYRFREADLDVFLKHRSSCIKQGSDGKFIQLNNNFRSRKEVTNAVNFLFGQIMSAQFGGVDYKDCEQLFSSGMFAKNSNFNTEFHILNNDSDLTDLEYEVKHITNTIKSMLLNGFKVSDGDSSLRPCKPSDFAILLRSGKKASNLLLKQLRELDVPVKSEVETGYFDAYEVALMVSLLQIIDNPLLDIPLCTVLLSPIFGFIPDELAQIRLEQKDMPLYLSLKESQNEHCKSFINILTQFRKKAAALPLSQLIQEIYNNTLFYSLFATSKSSEQKLVNLRLLLSQAEKYENSSSHGLSGFLRMIKHCKENGKGFETFGTVSKNINSVKIMTIHKSKGLEFPIVFVSLCGKRFNEQDFTQPVLLSSKFGLALKHSDPSTLSRYNTLPYNASVFAERNAMRAEELRVLYVAMTRAKDKLILTTTDKDQKYKNPIISDDILLPPSYCRNNNSFYDWLLAGFMRHPNAFFISPKIHFDSSEFDCSIIINTKLNEINQTENKKQYEKPDPTIIKTIKDQINFKYENQILSFVPSKLSVTDIVKKDKLTTSLKTPNFSESLTASEIGIATHSFLQYADFKNAKQNIDIEIERLLKKEFITKKQAEYLEKNKLKQFFDSKVYNLIEDADSVEREKSFIYKIKAKELYPEADDHEIIIQGIIDCVIEKNNKLIIIDYKTDRMSKDDIKKLYKKQLFYYKIALESLLKKPVISCLIYSLHLNATIECVEMP